MKATWDIRQVSPPSVRRVRSDFSNELRKRGKSDAEVYDGTIILGELLANACEHGRLPIRVELRATGKQWLLTVRDSGSGFVRRIAPFDPTADRGRGFQIVERLGGRIHISGGASANIQVTLPFGDSSSM